MALQRVAITPYIGNRRHWGPPVHVALPLITFTRAGGTGTVSPYLPGVTSRFVTLIKEGTCNSLDIAKGLAALARHSSPPFNASIVDHQGCHCRSNPLALVHSKP